MTFLKEHAPAILLPGILLILFAIKGIFLSLLMPWFQSPDEQIHYGTIQHWAEPAEKTWTIVEKPRGYSNDPRDIRTFNLPEETTASAFSSGFDAVKFEEQNTQDFSDPNIEAAILSNSWKRHVDTTPAAVSGTKSVFYLVASWLERYFADESIFVRMFSVRLLAVAFGALTVLFAYLTARKIGFSTYAAFLLTTLVAFQPMFAITAAQVNIDIALIFAFSLYLYAGVSLLRDGLHWGYVSLALAAVALGLLSKGPGIVLVAMFYPLFVWSAHQKLRLPLKRFLPLLIGVTVILAGLALLAVPKSYFLSITNFSTQSAFDSPLASIGKYLDKTLRTGELRDTALSYWGHFGWLDSSIPDWTLSLIILITLVGFGGTLWYIFSKQEKPAHLPERKYLVFFLGLIVLLQLAIRFYDWRVFDATRQVLIGQPGRYFLPNLIGHLAVVVTGLGFLLRQKERFTLLLKVLVGAMILLQVEAIVNVILPRYYL